MSRSRPYIYVVAGHDPSSGAGLTADIKTLEANRVYGVSACTALTWQHESEFQEVEWVSVDKIIRSMEVLSKKYRVEWIKIGIVENVNVLEEIVDWILEKNDSAKIILDPVLRASAGEIFHANPQLEQWRRIFARCYLMTPNWEEMHTLFPNQDPITAAKMLGKEVIVYLKGGHHPIDPGRDHLFTEEKTYTFRPKQMDVSAKHGSGCVLASAITANLARGYPLHKACLRAKNYTTRFLRSNPSLLGYHQR